jgi:hypothetical protein
VHAQTKFVLKKALVAFRYRCGADFFFRVLVLANLLTSQFVLAFGYNE